MRHTILPMLLLLLSLSTGAQTKVPVFIYAGQSNADGRDYVATMPDYLKVGTSPYAPYTHLQWASICGKPTASRFNARTLKNGERYAFCDVTNYWIDQAVSSDFYAIKCAYGGTSIQPEATAAKLPKWYAEATWLQSHNAYAGEDLTQETYANNNSLAKNLTEGFASLADAVLSQVDAGYDVKAIMWHQGESDRSYASAYYNNLKTLIAYLRQTIYEKTGDESDLALPFILGTVSRKSTQYNATVEAAQRQVASEDANCFLIDMKNATLRSDNLHFDARATEYLGIKMYNQLVDLGLVGGEKQAVEEFPEETSPMDDATEYENHTWTLAPLADTVTALLSVSSKWNINSGNYRYGSSLATAQLDYNDSTLVSETDGLYFTASKGNRVLLNPTNGLVFVGGDVTVYLPKLRAGQIVSFTAKRGKNNTATLKPIDDVADYVELISPSADLTTDSKTISFRVKYNFSGTKHIGFTVSGSAYSYYSKIEVKLPEHVSILIGADQKETFASDKQLDFSPFTDLFQAYIVTGYNDSKSALALQQVTKAPGGTGLLLMGEECQVNVPVIEPTDEVVTLDATNLLTAVVGEGTAPAGSYVLTTTNGATLFTKSVAAASLSDAAYLYLPDAVSTSFDTRQYTDVAIAPYLGGRQAAVSYTFDDGLQSQYTLAYPEMKKRGLRATFAVIGSKVGGMVQSSQDEEGSEGTPAMTWEQLQEMAADGFEIANHGWEHLKLTALGDEEAIRHEVERGDSVITEKIGQKPLTFVYPYNAYNADIQAFCESGRIGSRTSQYTFGGSRDLSTMNKWVDGIIEAGSWGVAMTHGIDAGYDHFSDPQTLFSHWDYVTTLQNKLWVAPFCEVAAYVKERDNATIIIDEDDDDITVTVSTTLDATLFTQPLTLIVDARAEWAKQGDDTLNIVLRGGQTLVTVNPQGGSVTIRKSKGEAPEVLASPACTIALTTYAKNSQLRQPVISLNSENTAAVTYYYKVGESGEWTALEGTQLVPEVKGIYTFKAVAEGYDDSDLSSSLALAPLYRVVQVVDLTADSLYTASTSTTGAFSWGDDWGFSADQEFGKLSTTNIGGFVVENKGVLASRYSYARGIGVANNYGYTYTTTLGSIYGFAEYVLYQNHSLTDLATVTIHNPSAAQTKFPSQKQGAVKALSIYEPAEVATITIGDAGYATYSNVSALDFTGSGITAYYATQDGHDVRFDNELQNPAAATGLLLKADAGTYEVVLTQSGTDVSSENRLVACLSEKTVGTTEGCDYGSVFILSRRDGKLGFFRSDNGRILQAGKSYLHLESVNEARAIIGFPLDGVPTGLCNFGPSTPERGSLFDLQGRRIADSQSPLPKGLYIQGGKKTIIK